MAFISFPEFLQKGLTPYHVTSLLKQLLTEAGFVPLQETTPFALAAGGRYFVTRADASLIAFSIPGGGGARSFSIGAAHSDSPALRITGEKHDGHYVRLSTEKYGGLLCTTWFDRPLKLAGRVFVREENRSRSVLFEGDRCVVIPSVAPHQNREANEKAMANPAVDLLPIFSKDDGDNALKRSLAKQLSVVPEAILSDDLYLVCADAPTLWGDEYITAPRLDDLACVYGLLDGFLAAQNEQSIPVFAVFNGEEIGSMSIEGADSTFLSDTLFRICTSLAMDPYTTLAGSFLLSADNAHGIHPAHPELFHRESACYLNGGIVIKHTASRRYTTDGYSAAMVRLLCERAGVPVQEFHNRADLPGGSTLGNIANTHISVPSADIGISQLAMHSANETCGIRDVEYLSTLAKYYFSATRRDDEDTADWSFTCDKKGE